MEKSRIILKSGAEFRVDDNAALQFATGLSKGVQFADTVQHVGVLDDAGESAGVLVVVSTEIAAVVVSGDKLKP